MIIVSQLGRRCPLPVRSMVAVSDQAGEADGFPPLQDRRYWVRVPRAAEFPESTRKIDMLKLKGGAGRGGTVDRRNSFENSAVKGCLG